MISISNSPDTGQDGVKITTIPPDCTNLKSELRASSMDHQKLTEYLETLCQSGCETVNATIEAMEKNQPTSVTDELTSDEQEMVLQELKSIMSVYKQ